MLSGEEILQFIQCATDISLQIVKLKYEICKNRLVTMSERTVQINNFLQFYMERENLEKISIKEAAKLLSEHGILQDSLSSPGYPLRRHAVKGTLLGAMQSANGRWWIQRIDDYSPLVSAAKLAQLLGFQHKTSIYRKFRTVNLPPIRNSRKGICFQLKDLLNWANESGDFELFRKLSSLNIEGV